MALGRPHSKDYPGKYKDSFELFRLTQPKAPSGTTLADQIAAYLEWAITQKQAGFEKGEIIHARLKSWDGKSAFHKIMALRSGRYIFSNHLPSVRHTITDPLSLLLLSMRSQNPEKKKPASKTSRQKEEIFN